MKRLLLILTAAIMAGCASTPEPEPTPPTAPPKAARKAKPKPVAVFNDPNANITNALGMGRSPADLGFREKAFDPCRFGLSAPGACQPQVLTVVHFQLLCRDSEGTVSEVPSRLMPIVAKQVTWQIGPQTGNTQTDRRGYGQFTAVSPRSIRNQRLLLRIGPQFVAVTTSEVNKIVLPVNFCQG